MALTTITVTVRVTGQGATPVAGAVVSALLDRRDVDQDEGYVIPELQEATTDALGVATLDLWPNARGSTGSRYRFTITTADGTLAWTAWASLPETNCDLGDVAENAEVSLPNWPVPDQARRERVIGDIMDMLHQDASNTAAAAKVGRWLDHVLHDLSQYDFWWWRRIAGTTLGLGADVVDLSGHIARIGAIWAGAKRLTRETLPQVVTWRATTQAGAQSPTHYALEAGYRVHLWPAPAADTPFRVLYQRPADAAIVPDQWEHLLIYGVLGLWGRHWDRGALAQTPDDYERRYYRDIAKALADEAADPVFAHTYDWLTVPPGTGASAWAGDGPPSAYTVPASLGGVGYTTVECGCYPITVH